MVQSLKSLKNQIPYATSRTVNTLGKMVQADTIGRVLQERFTLRTGWWRSGRKYGVNYFASNKKQADIKAIVNTQAPFMVLQETGGQKIPKAGYQYVAVPTKHAWPDRKKLIPYHSRFSSLTREFKRRKSRTLSHGGNFWVKLPHEKDPVIAIRGPNGKLRVMYRGRGSVTIKPRFGFRKNAERIVDENRGAVWRREFALALATAFKI